MAKSSVTKVGAGTQPAEKEEKGRIDFPIKDAKYRDKDGNVVTAVNADGLLIAVPQPIKDGDKVIYGGFNTRKYKPLKKGEFASIDTYMRYQAYVSRIRAAVLVKRAVELEAKAVRISKYGDVATRRKVQKVSKMKEQLALLQKQLKEDGVDISEID